METAFLASVIPVIYLAGVLTALRVITWTAAGTAWRNHESMCWGSCYGSCDRRMPHQGWSSRAHAFTDGLHPQDWAVASAAALFWPLLLPVYACWHPAKWFLMHPPKEKLKLTLDEKLQRAEAELEAARTAQAKAQE